MSYNRDIPQSTDLISSSQPSLLGNFQAIDSGTTGTGTGFSRNHITMTDGTNGGLHNRVDFYQTLSDPTISGFVASIYEKLVSSNAELFHSNSTGISTQITSGALPIWKGGPTGTTGVVTATIASTGAINLPNGLQFRWGSANVTASPTQITFGTPFSNACFSVVLTPTADTARVVNIYNMQPVTVSSFYAIAASNTNFTYYFAIGN